MLKKIGILMQLALLGIITGAASCSFWKPCCDKNTSGHHNSSSSHDANKATHAKQTILHITNEKDFNEQVLKNTKPTVVKFEAEWCGACKKIAHLFQDVAEELGDLYSFASVDIDAAKQVATTYKLRGVPTLIFIQDGKEVTGHDRIVGSFSDKAAFIASIKAAFATPTNL